MFDKLEDLRIRLDEILNELQEPDVANDQNRFRKLMKEQNDMTAIVEAYNDNNETRFRNLMKEQSDLAPIVEAFKEYKQCKQNVEDSLMM